MTKPDQHAISSILGSEIVGNVPPAHGQMASASNVQRYMESKRAEREPMTEERFAEIKHALEFANKRGLYVKLGIDLLAEVERLKVQCDRLTAELHALKHPPVLTKPDGPGWWAFTGGGWRLVAYADDASLRRPEHWTGRTEFQRITLPTPPTETVAGKDGG